MARLYRPYTPRQVDWTAVKIAAAFIVVWAALCVWLGLVDHSPDFWRGFGAWFGFRSEAQWAALWR